jgi:hypothetical protein
MSWEIITSMSPIDPPYDNWPDTWMETRGFYPKDVPSYAMCGTERVPLTGNKRAFINAWIGEKTGEPALKWYLMHENMSITMWKDKEFVTKYDNTFAAWHDIKIRLKEWAHGAEKAQNAVAKVWKKDFYKTR